MHRRYVQEPAEAHDITSLPLVSQPQPHAAPFEQTGAVADALLAPFTRQQLAVHQIATDVIVLNEP